jgi:hypothetical protein
MSEAGEYYGKIKIIPADRWLDPEPYEVSRFFEQSLDDPDARIAEFGRRNSLLRMSNGAIRITLLKKPCRTNTIQVCSWARYLVATRSYLS